MDHKTSGIFFGIFLAVLGVLAASSVKTIEGHDGLLRVYFFDIGHGDAILIQAPNGNQVLVDGGPDGGIIEKLQATMGMFDHSLDAVVVTHPHNDHIAGLVEVLKAYEVGTVLEAHETYDSGIFRKWEEGVGDEGAMPLEALPGNVLDLGTGVTLTVLYPPRSFDHMTLKNPHDANVTTLLKYGEFELLLTGDMEAEAEQFLIDHGAPLDVDVLKVGHHGSKTSTSVPFLQATTPQVAIISVAKKNTYGLPAPSIVSRIENFGVTLYRTDEDGDIRLISDGKRYTIETD